MLTKTAAQRLKISARTPAKKTSASKTPAKKSASPAKPAPLGALPEWDLSALYAGIGAPEIKRDLARADADCNGFGERYKGKLAGLAGGPDGGRALAAAIKELEAIDDLAGLSKTHPGVALLSKPYRKSDLAQKIREVLASG